MKTKSFLGFLVYWFLGFGNIGLLVSWFVGFLVFGFLVSWFLGLQVSWYLNHKVPKICHKTISCVQEDIGPIRRISRFY